jgi:hypothetical protein
MGGASTPYRITVTDFCRAMEREKEAHAAGNDAIYILDYKPDATTNKPFAQLTIYALALLHLTGIPVFDFKCGTVEPCYA